MKKTLTVAKSFQLKADCLLNNQDLLVNLTGGNIPHIGGVVTFDQKTKEETVVKFASHDGRLHNWLLYTSPGPRDAHESRLPSSA